MKHFMTLMALLVAVTAGAQFDPIQPPYNPDVDMDGMISVEDLMALLSLFSSEFEAYSMSVDADTTVALLNAGEMDFWDCAMTCDTIEGNWKVFDYHNYGLFKGELEFPTDRMWLDVEAGIHNSYYVQVIKTNTHSFDNHSPQQIAGCVCQTEVMEQIEYTYVAGGSDSFQSEVDEKLAEGWFLLGGISNAGNWYNAQAFWRWAE